MTEMIERLRKDAEIKIMSAEMLDGYKRGDFLPEAVRERMMAEHPELHMTLGEENRLEAGYLSLAANHLDGSEPLNSDQLSAICAKLTGMAERSDDYAERQKSTLEEHYDDDDNRYEEYEDADVDDPDDIRDSIEESKDEAAFLRSVVEKLAS